MWILFLLFHWITIKNIAISLFGYLCSLLWSLIGRLKYQIHGYSKESMDRLGDDMTEEILQYLTLEDKIRLECVSKQWKRCVFQKQFVIEIDYNRDRKGQNSLNGLFRRIDDERQSDEQRLVSVMKKCQNIRKVILRRITKSNMLSMIRYFAPFCVFDEAVNYVRNYSNDLSFLEKYDQNNQRIIKYLLNSNRYAFDSEVLSLFGQYCPNIKSLDITITGEQDLQFFRMFGHKIQELIFEAPTDIDKVIVNSSSKNMEMSFLLKKDKEFLPKLQNLRIYLSTKFVNLENMNNLIDKYSRKVKSIILLFEYLPTEELMKCVECISRFENLKSLTLELSYIEPQPIDDCLSLIGQKCTKLLKLDLIINRYVEISDRFFNVFTHFKAIKKLKCHILQTSKRITFKGSVECFRHCKQLYDIDIHCKGLPKDFFTNTKLILPQLQTLTTK